MLTEEQKTQYQEDGYFLLPKFISSEEVEDLKISACKLLDLFDPETHPLTKFTTGENEDYIGDSYFLNSGGKIRYFLEVDAVKDGTLCVPKEKAINKIGHALHTLDSAFRKFSMNDKIKSLAKDLNFKNPAILQSMLIFKQPCIGGAVPPHQDSTFLFTEPLSATGLWLTLEDCTLENGYLSFFPGSHKSIPAVEIKYEVIFLDTPIERRFVRVKDPKTGSTTMELVGDDYSKEQTSSENYKPALIPEGTLVLIHGSVLHKSEPNRSEKSRLIYTFHMIENKALYPKENWLQPTPEMPFETLY